MIKIAAEFITQPGLIGEIIRETRTRATVRITDCYFPAHYKSWGISQITDPKEQAYWLELFTGQERTFWKTGSRQNYEVGHTWKVVDWNYTTGGKGRQETGK